MKAQLPDEVNKVLNAFQNAGFEVYVVGGAVRDLLTGRIVEDWDFTTNAVPEEIMKLFSDSIYDNAFGTVMIPFKNYKTPFDITTYRTEHGYSDSRRPDKVSWGQTIEKDLKRRDFTINAFALKPAKNGDYELIDLFGGESDLKNKIIRAVGDPNERFSEDALRMMRAIRIASELGYTIEDKTLLAIKNNAKLLNKIAGERIRDELFKIILSPNPYEGMLLLKDSKLMTEILPEMEKTIGVEQKSPGRHHVHDVWNHSLLSLKHVSEKTTDPIVRFATLIHDIGKPQTYKKLEKGTITFYNHEMVSARIAKNIAYRLKFSKKQAERFWKLVRYHQFTVDERQTDKAIRRFIKKVGLENIEDMLNLRVGDRLGGGARETSWRLEEFKKRLIEVQKQPFTVHDLKINGNDVMKELNLKPGPKVGEILDKIFEEVVDKKIQNDREVLLKELKNFI